MLTTSLAGGARPPGRERARALARFLLIKGEPQAASRYLAERMGASDARRGSHARVLLLYKRHLVRACVCVCARSLEEMRATGTQGRALCKRIDSVVSTHPPGGG